MLLATFVLFRLGVLAQVAIGLVSAYPTISDPVANVGLATTLLLSSTALIIAGVRRHAPPPTWAVAADAAWIAVGLCLGALLVEPGTRHTWSHFMYPYSLVACVGIGLVYRRLAAVLTVAAMVLTGYVVSAAMYLAEPVWNIVPNSATYVANASLAWALARMLRRTARRIDELTTRTARHERELATVRERERHARLLHDRSLQTLEMLSRGPWIDDRRLRDHVAAEAAWLRGLVRGDPPTPGGVAERIHELVLRHLRAGLDVTVLDRQLCQLREVDQLLTSPAADALSGAIDEALTNVSKHAGVTSAVLTIDVTADHIRATVVDHGCGFDPRGLGTANFGIARSIRGRLAAVGGTSAVYSQPRHGTQVEVCLPIIVSPDRHG